ncbi:MAG: flagellar filament capping protein FliD [Hydrogenoanaerobacterium sp.]
MTVTRSETARLLGFKADASTDSAAKGTTKLSELGLGADFAMNLTIGTGANKQSLKLTLADFGGENGTVESMQAAINTSLRAAEATSTEVPKPKPGTYGTAAFDDPPGRFRLFGVDIPMEIAVTGENSKALFAGDKLSLGNGAMSTDANAFLDTAGQNAVLSVNGVEVERNSNVFTYDDLSFELLATTRKDDASGNPIPETITVTRDTDQIYDGLKKFVDEYNKVVESINKLLSAEPSYKEYAPLTSEQRKSMSESEAKTWDEKSKEGLLRRDPALEAVMTDMRGLLYSKPKDSNIALYEMGIKTYMSYEPLDAGKITLSNAGADLKKMIAERPDDVAKLFLSEQGGLSKGMMDVIDRASLVSITKPGTLVSIAGSSNTDTSSNIYKQMKNINDSLDTLERTYTTEYNRYWKQFNTMESMIQNMNTQSSWLTQQLGGS